MYNGLNEKEIVIMSLLRNNSRETLTKMSRKSKIPVSTIYDKIKLREKDVIKKHTCILDFSKLGFNTRASLSIKVAKGKKDDFLKEIKNHPNINTIYKINNGFDFWIECIFRHIRELEDFVERIEADFGVKKQIFYIIDDIKREAFMSDPELLDLTGG
jgi:DNA-binding Lrp family transcriptional regulator